MKLRYPTMIYGVYRWSESVGGDIRAAEPCKNTTCDGHRSQHAAALHHTMWFCEKAGIDYSIDKEAKKQCVVCGNWTNVRVSFIGCPYEDAFPMCMDHNEARDYLTSKHMKRRDLWDHYKHLLACKGKVRLLPIAHYDELMENAIATAQA